MSYRTGAFASFLLIHLVAVPAFAQEDAEEASSETIDVTVHTVSEADRKRRSSEAVTVIETTTAQRESADLGEVMARSAGVAIRKSGGLGSYARVSLAGLQDDQIRLFYDGIPLDIAGFGFGIANVPVNLVSSVEVYRGVVPLRLGVDALGGAINLVPDRSLAGTHAAASYELGAFGIHRSTLIASHRTDGGLYAGVSGFLDLARNDYPIDVEVADDSGQLSPATVDHYHNDYAAGGARLELGVFGQPWARRLFGDVHVAGYDKDIPTNVVMTLPYGEARYGELSVGTNLHYEQPLTDQLTLSAVVGYGHDARDFQDKSEWVYDWYGRRVRQRARPGELGGGRAYDQIVYKQTGFARTFLAYRPADGHELRFAVAPTLSSQTGEDYLNAPGTRDPLAGTRTLFSLVSGVEYETDLVDERLENVAFVKDYLYQARSQEILAGDVAVDRRVDSHRFGVGDTVRFRLLEWLWLKGSYELTTRLPTTDEVFGDGALVVANLELEPEHSHNANVGVVVDARDTPAGEWRGEVNGFFRRPEDLIVAFPMDVFVKYVNVFSGRAYGVEAAAGWTAPGGWLIVDANGTYVDYRNTSSEGAFGNFDGDRIPNRPYLFANGAARVELSDVSLAGDSLSLGWYSRYVHEFYRGWESVGIPSLKQVIPAQLTHSVGVSYRVVGRESVTTSVELQNLTDARVFDSFGVQKPGRGVFVKASVEY